MKRNRWPQSILVLPCFVALLVSAHPVSAGENLMPNPSVETADPVTTTLPDGWVNNYWGDAVAYFEWADDGHDGTKGLLVELESVSEGDAKWLTEPFSIPSGLYEITVGVWYRSNVTTRLTVRANGDSGQTSWLFPKEYVPASEEGWALAQGTIVLEPWVKTIEVMMVLPEAGWLVTDDYMVEAGFVEPDPDAIVEDDITVNPPDTSSGDFEFPPGWTPPKISIAFDDGWVSAFEQAIPIMAEFGFRGTHFIIADYVDKPGYQADHVTSHQLEKLAKAGHEIGSHSSKHDDLATLSGQTLYDELGNSHDRLESFDLDVVGLAPPGGSYSQELLEMAPEHYKYLRTIDVGYNQAPYDAFALKAVSLRNTTTLEEIHNFVVDAGSNNGWLIIIYHRMSINAPAETFVTPDQFRSHMQYFKDIGAEVKPIGEMLGVWEPVVIPDTPGGKSFPPATYEGGGISEPDNTDPGQTPKPSNCSAGANPSAGWLMLLLLAAAFAAVSSVRRKA